VAEIAGLLSEHFAIPNVQAQTDVAAVLAEFEQLQARFKDARQTAPPTRTRAPNATAPVRFAWESSLALAGRNIRLRVEDAALGRQLQSILAHLRSPEENACDRDLQLLGNTRDWNLVCDGLPCGRVNAGAIANTIHQLVELACASSEKLLVLHGAGLAMAGQGVLLIGPGRSGKTTLSAALNATGFELLGDDVVPVTPAGDLLGIGMSLCLKPGSWPVLADYMPGLEHADVIDRGGLEVKFVPPPGPVARRPVRAALFLFPRHAPDSEPAIEAVDGVGVLQRMIEAESLLLDLDQQKLERLTAWVRSAPGYAIRFPDLATGLGQVRELVARHLCADQPA